MHLVTGKRSGTWKVRYLVSQMINVEKHFIPILILFLTASLGKLPSSGNQGYKYKLWALSHCREVFCPWPVCCA